MPPSKYIIRSPRADHVPAIYNLIRFFNYRNALLPKPLNEIKKEVGSFLVAGPAEILAGEDPNPALREFTNSTTGRNRSEDSPSPDKGSLIWEGRSMSATESGGGKPEPPPLNSPPPDDASGAGKTSADNIPFAPDSSGRGRGPGNEVPGEYNPRAGIMGCVAVKKFTRDLHEIRSFAVWPEFQKLGLGGRLLEVALERAPAGRLFTLTFIPGYFEKYGFQRVAKETLPEKIWRDCWRCRFINDCNETALVYHKT